MVEPVDFESSHLHLHRASLEKPSSLFSGLQALPIKMFWNSSLEAPSALRCGHSFLVYALSHFGHSGRFDRSIKQREGAIKPVP